MAYSTVHSNCISFISFGEFTHLSHSTLGILHFMIVALLPYCKGLPEVFAKLNLQCLW